MEINQVNIRVYAVSGFAYLQILDSALQGITCAHNNRPNKTTINTNTRF